MTQDKLEDIGQQVAGGSAGGKDPRNPPLHLWHPDLSGDIDILIGADGTWFHEGEPIRRQALVNLFASILRREADGEYYLVTPVEKWRLRVERLPLLIVDFDLRGQGSADQVLSVVTNTGRRYVVGKAHPLYLPEPEEGIEQEIPAVSLEHGLAALFNRAAWYRLAAVCEERDGVAGIASDGLFFPIAR